MDVPVGGFCGAHWCSHELLVYQCSSLVVMPICIYPELCGAGSLSKGGLGATPRAGGRLGLDGWGPCGVQELGSLTHCFIPCFWPAGDSIRMRITAQ